MVSDFSFSFLNDFFSRSLLGNLLWSDMYHVNHYDKCCQANDKSGVIGGVAAMLIITLSIPSGETLYVFALEFLRLLQRFVAI